MPELFTTLEADQQPAAVADVPRQTEASRRRAARIAADVTKTITVTVEDVAGLPLELQIVTLGYNDRPLFFEAAAAFVRGENLPAGITLSENEAIGFTAMLQCVRDENGDPFFDVETLLAYRADVEDQPLLLAILEHVIAANPRIMKPVSADEAQPDSKPDSEADEGQNQPATIGSENQVAPVCVT